MDQKIASITLEGFRTFRKFKLQGLGHVNLITGRNNTGKSSLLEALQLFASNATLEVIKSILENREENLGEKRQEPEDEDLLPALSSLFHGSLEHAGLPEPILMMAEGAHGPMKLKLEPGWLLDETRKAMRNSPEQEAQLDETGENLVLAVTTEEKSLVRELRNLRYIWRERNSGPSTRTRIPCMFVGSCGGRETEALAHLWDQIALSDEEKHVVEALQIIDDRITAVSVVGTGVRSFPRSAIVRAHNFVRPVPLRSFGDGPEPVVRHHIISCKRQGRTPADRRV